MLFEFSRNYVRDEPVGEFLAVDSRQVPLMFVRHRRARRYVLRLRPDGVARVTVPRGASLLEARRFAERNLPWLRAQFEKLAARPKSPSPWHIGTSILLRGEMVQIQAGANGDSGLARVGTETVHVEDVQADLRVPIQLYLWNLAAGEFPTRVLELAAIHQLHVRRVTVRNQRSRWGSCSRRGTISLNWRLIQAPPSVRDYVILHELAHLREMNHSPRFWQLLEQFCPDYRAAEQWLKSHGRNSLRS